MIIQDLAVLLKVILLEKIVFLMMRDFTGRFTFLNDAVEGDIVIRHKINGKGVELQQVKI